MSVEALWSVRFGHAGGGENFPMNGGIVVLETDRVLGGDSWFSYVGTYVVHGNQISGQIQIGRHHTDPQSTDAWNSGDDNFSIIFGAVLNANNTSAIGEMVRTGYPQNIAIKLTRIAELPGA